MNKFNEKITKSLINLARFDSRAWDCPRYGRAVPYFKEVYCFRYTETMRMLRRKYGHRMVAEHIKYVNKLGWGFRAPQQ